jgi:16S rRNA A1518/A1519 N6-dimethyltransferase RsmA/KsgA/DIM1 with predicted DNA glycosylase/AP lyase activity
VSTRAKKDLGQHFLADENILRVIGRLAELDGADVVLESAHDLLDVLS